MHRQRRSAPQTKIRHPPLEIQTLGPELRQYPRTGLLDDCPSQMIYDIGARLPYKRQDMELTEADRKVFLKAPDQSTETFRAAGCGLTASCCRSESELDDYDLLLPPRAEANREVRPQYPKRPQIKGFTVRAVPRAGA